MSEYAERLADGLRKQFGAEWYLIGAEPHHLRDYARATDDSDRARVRRAMESQTRHLAHSMIQAGLLGGVVTDVEQETLQSHHGLVRRADD